MQQYLVNHAMQNVWCNPYQDNQLIFAAHKITKVFGELNKFPMFNRMVQLPTQGVRYHVFQVGQIHPNVLGLLSSSASWSPETWVKFSDAMIDRKILANIYTTSGAMLPRFKAYYMYSNERNLVFAIEIDKNINLDYENDNIYVRIYSNAYFESARADASLEYIYTKGLSILNVDEIVALQSEYETYKAKAGKTTAYCNGFMISEINPIVVKPSDTVEFVYDSSVKRVVTFTISDLTTFTSILDSKEKYLLHHLSGGNDTIDFQDDIDIHIAYEDEFGRLKGYYYHRNNIDSHRMVTHRDYAIVVEYFNYIATKLNEDISSTPLDFRNLKLEVVIRDAGYFRPLIYDNARLFELYKLPSEKILAAMTGVHSTVPEWRADVLENNAYSKLMRSYYPDINLQMVQDAYGYNGISKIVGDTPVKTTYVPGVGNEVVKVPYGLQNNSTAYEYDENGLMIGYYTHNSGTNYWPTDSARLVEFISGEASYTPDVIFGTDNIPLPSYDNYRVYMCYIVAGVPNNDWRDITGSSNYTVANNKLIWSNEEFDQYLMVRTDKKFLAYDIDLNLTNGIYHFTLTEEQDRGNGLVLSKLLLPLGELDIFLNGKSLINGLDYIVNFPEVYIVNKKYLIHPLDSTPQKVHVRYTGFCNKDLSMDEIDDHGFIEHGVLSNNSKFDLRDDKVLRITVDGNIKHRDDVIFSELHDGVSIVNVSNGLPYLVKDIVVPLKELVNENTYSLRTKSIAIDRSISDYMTIKLPQPERNAPSAIPKLYTLTSPFISRIIKALTSGHIDMDFLMTNYSDMDVINKCNEFEILFKVDPANIDRNTDFRYIIVHPHSYTTPINLNIYQYRFLTKVTKLYTEDRVQLNPFVTFTPV